MEQPRLPSVRQESALADIERAEPHSDGGPDRDRLLGGELGPDARERRRFDARAHLESLLGAAVYFR